MFKFLFYALLGLNALLIYSWCTLFFLPAGARDARLSFKLGTGALTLFVCAVSILVWYFKETGYQRAASITLYGFYGLALVALLWAMKNGRWN